MANYWMLLATNAATFIVTFVAVKLYCSWKDQDPVSECMVTGPLMTTSTVSVAGPRNLHDTDGSCCACREPSSQPSSPAADPTTSPTNPSTTQDDLPLVTSIEDFEFTGAFRLRNGQFGVSSLDYSTGVLAYNPARDSLFIVGHDQQQAIAEYPIIDGSIDELTLVADLPETSRPLQDFVGVLDRIDNPDGLNRVTGMVVLDGVLYVNVENWYDAGGTSQATTLYFPATSDLAGTDPVGFFRLQGRSQSAGYMGRIPLALQPKFRGAEYYTGWSSVYSILSRYSQGPSLWTFSPQDMLRGSSDDNLDITATPWMNYPYSDNDMSKWLSLRATEWSEQGTLGPFPLSDPLWNPLSEGRYAFFVPNTKTYCVIGSTAGLASGMGYKAVQSNGHECPGPCPYDPDDWYNYFWLYNVDDIVGSTDPWEPRPYAYGVWTLPYVTNPEQHRIAGATVDEDRGILYIALSNAAKVGAYDQPPLILTYDINIASLPPSDTGGSDSQPEQDVPSSTSGATSAFWGS